MVSVSSLWVLHIRNVHSISRMVSLGQRNKHCLRTNLTLEDQFVFKEAPTANLISISLGFCLHRIWIVSCNV